MFLTATFATAILNLSWVQTSSIWAQNPKLDLEFHIKQSQRALHFQDFAKAIEHYEKALQLDEAVAKWRLNPGIIFVIRSSEQEYLKNNTTNWPLYRQIQQQYQLLFN